MAVFVEEKEGGVSVLERDHQAEGIYPGVRQISRDGGAHDRPRRAAVQTIVFIAGGDRPSSGEMRLLDSPEGAERLIERLLECGVPPERIHVFSGEAVRLAIVYRPVVSFGDGQEVCGEGLPPQRPEAGPQPISDAVSDAKRERFSSLFRRAHPEWEPLPG